MDFYYRHNGDGNRRWTNPLMTDSWRNYSSIPPPPTKQLLKLKKQNAPKEMLQYCGPIRSGYSCGDSGIHNTYRYSSDFSEAFSDSFDKISLGSNTSIDNKSNHSLDLHCELCYYTECARCDVVGKQRPSVNDNGVWTGHCREMCPLAHFNTCLCGSISGCHKNEHNLFLT